MIKYKGNARKLFPLDLEKRTSNFLIFVCFEMCDGPLKNLGAQTKITRGKGPGNGLSGGLNWVCGGVGWVGNGMQ